MLIRMPVEVMLHVVGHVYKDGEVDIINIFNDNPDPKYSEIPLNSIVDLDQLKADFAEEAEKIHL